MTCHRYVGNGPTNGTDPTGRWLVAQIPIPLPTPWLKDLRDNGIHASGYQLPGGRWYIQIPDEQLQQYCATWATTRTCCTPPLPPTSCRHRAARQRRGLRQPRHPVDAEISGLDPEQRRHHLSTSRPPAASPRQTRWTSDSAVSAPTRRWKRTQGGGAVPGRPGPAAAGATVEEVSSKFYSDFKELGQRGVKLLQLFLDSPGTVASNLLGPRRSRTASAASSNRRRSGAALDQPGPRSGCWARGSRSPQPVEFQRPVAAEAAVARSRTPARSECWRTSSRENTGSRSRASTPTRSWNKVQSLKPLLEGKTDELVSTLWSEAGGVRRRPH